MKKLLLIVLLIFALTLSGCKVDSEKVYRNITIVEQLELEVTILYQEVQNVSPNELYGMSTYYEYCREYDYQFRTETIYVHIIGDDYEVIDKIEYEGVKHNE